MPAQLRRYGRRRRFITTMAAAISSSATCGST
jgi:hypothetical protein